MSDLSVYLRSKAYRPALPAGLIMALTAVGGIISSYGSGYFFYWIFTIDYPVRQDFDILNPMWILGMMIGLIITLDIYMAGYDYGNKTATRKLYRDNDGDDEKSRIDWDILKTLRLFSRYTTVIGLLCLTYGKIDFLQQKQVTAADLLQDKKAMLDSLLANPVPPVTTLPEYIEAVRLLNNGDKSDDAGAQAEKDRILARQWEKERAWQRKVDALQTDLADMKLGLVELDNTALFKFLQDVFRISSKLMIIISIAIAAVAMDRSFGNMAVKTGEYFAYYGARVAYSDIVLPSTKPSTGGVNLPSTVNVDAESAGSDAVGGGVDFDNRKVQEILHDIKFKYGHIKPDGRRTSFSDIGKEHGVKKQYVHKIKEAAIEQGLLPANFMKQFEVA